MTDQAPDAIEAEAPEAPPLWGTAVFQRAEVGAADFHAQVKVSGEGLRIEGEGALSKGEVLTDPQGNCWQVVEVKQRADSGYSWATLANAGAQGEGAERQEDVNQSAPDQAAEAPAPTRARRRKPADDRDSDDAASDGDAPAE